METFHRVGQRVAEQLGPLPLSAENQVQISPCNEQNWNNLISFWVNKFFKLKGGQQPSNPIM
jgi:hypothetical protein